MIHRLWTGLGILFELMTNIVDERGLGDFRQRLMLRCEPAREVEKVVSVNAQRTERELPQTLTVQEGIGPVGFRSLIATHSIGGDAGGHRRLIDHEEFHSGWAPSRQRAKSAALAP